MRNYLIPFGLFLALLFPSLVNAVEIISVRQVFDNDKKSILQSDVNSDQLVMTLTKEVGHSLISVSTFTANEVEYHRLQQHYKTIPVWAKQVTVSRDSNSKSILRLGGQLATKLTNEIDNINPSFSLKEALKASYSIAKLTKYQIINLENEESQLVIYADDNRARLAWVISYFSDGDGAPSRPYFIIDAQTGELIKQWDGLTFQNATGPGGNLKTGQYLYGTNFGFLDVNNQCEMDNANVKTVDLNHGTSGSTAFQFTCPNNNYQTINGAYSPLNDAHFFGGVVYDMYNSWVGVPPLTFQLMMRVHYSNNYQNAFWNGSSMTFGDGASTFYPLVGLDVSGHEVSHGFTQQNSGLIYSGQSGGINEAFSDMAGEAAEYFMNNSNDFWVGAEIYKAPNSALRYMDNPPLDGISIDHVTNYYNGMDVHYSSGIFNKAFYLIATGAGWDTQKAFKIFARANQAYWTPSTDFVDGACGTLYATNDLGYDLTTVHNAFAQVGITCPGFANADAYIKDLPADTGIEPDPVAGNMWTSQEIWNSHDSNPAGGHQNPEFGQTNYMFVRLRNDGPNQTPASITGRIHLYYANASTGLAWPANWTEFGTIPVSNLSASGIIEGYAPFVPPGTGHYCIVARWVSDQDLMTFVEGGSINTNTRNNNNIAWRNMNIVNDFLLPEGVSNQVIVRNISRREDTIALGVIDLSERNTFIDFGEITLDLGDELLERWIKSGAKGEGIIFDERSRKITLASKKAMLYGMVMEAAEEFKVNISFVAPKPTGQTFHISLTQYDSKLKPVGGVDYLIQQEEKK